MNKTIPVLVVLLLRLSLFSADRYIWLHGMEGEHGANTWDIYNSMFTKNEGMVLEYTSDNTIGAIAKNLYLNQIKPVETSGSMVIVGHSMGGLVARSLLAYSPRISGVIVVGTANNGSALLMNTLNGKVIDFFSSAIKMANSAIDASLYAGIFTGVPVTTLAAPLIVPISIFKSRTVNSTLFYLKHASNSAVGVYQLGHPCIRDMVPGSPFLTNLNSVSTNVPLINIYGAEDHWQVVRALGSLSKVDAVKNAANIDIPYDQSYFPALQAGLAFMYEIQSTHNLVYNALGIAAVFMPWIWVTRELVLKARYNWDAMYRYLETGIHTDLAGMMGATQYKLQNYCVPLGTDLNNLSCKMAYLPVVMENDGVLSRADVVLPSNSRRTVFNVRVPGVNHQEMGNHITMRKLMEEIIYYKSYGNAFAK
jgi:pimeloyl-ACP methyl ester carboxylesterase